MNWLTNFIRPKIRSFVQQKEVPDNLWNKCPSCEGMLFNRDLKENHNVCSHCSYHMRISTKERLDILFDNSEYKLLHSPKNIASDPLKFKDRKRYIDRIKDAQSKSGSKDAIIVAKGTIGNLPVIVAAFDFSFMGGSMGAAVGEGIIYASEQAIKNNAALITIPSSGGARMQEGMISLMQMPRSIVAVEMVKDKGLPYIVLLTDPTTGGVSASFAMVGDIHIAEPGCMIGFAGKRVIQETIREELPDNFQTAEYLQENGMVDLVIHRHELKGTIAKIVQLLMTPIAPEKDKSSNKKGNNQKNKKNNTQKVNTNQSTPQNTKSELLDTKTPANKNDPKQKKSPVKK